MNHKAYAEIEEVLNRTDWRKYSNLAAHNCRHISMSLMRSAVTDADFVEGRTP